MAEYALQCCPVCGDLWVYYVGGDPTQIGAVVGSCLSAETRHHHTPGRHRFAKTYLVCEGVEVDTPYTDLSIATVFSPEEIARMQALAVLFDAK